MFPFFGWCYLHLSRTMGILWHSCQFKVTVYLSRKADTDVWLLCLKIKTTTKNIAFYLPPLQDCLTFLKQRVCFFSLPHLEKARLEMNTLFHDHPYTFMLHHPSWCFYWWRIDFCRNIESWLESKFNSLYFRWSMSPRYTHEVAPYRHEGSHVRSSKHFGNEIVHHPQSHSQLLWQTWDTNFSQDVCLHSPHPLK